jgi:hypothetical protein
LPAGICQETSRATTGASSSESLAAAVDPAWPGPAASSGPESGGGEVSRLSLAQGGLPPGMPVATEPPRFSVWAHLGALDVTRCGTPTHPSLGGVVMTRTRSTLPPVTPHRSRPGGAALRPAGPTVGSGRPSPVHGREAHSGFSPQGSAGPAVRRRHPAPTMAWFGPAKPWHDLLTMASPA